MVFDLVGEPISQGEAYINVMEDDLVILIEKILASQLIIGKQIGIISYNETPIKKIILNEITTLSTDFHQMGITASQLVLSNLKECIEVPFKLILRASL